MLKVKYDNFSRIAYVISDAPISVMTAYYYEKLRKEGSPLTSKILSTSEAVASWDDNGTTLYLFTVVVIPTFEEMRDVFPDARKVIHWAVIRNTTSGETELVVGTVSAIHTTHQGVLYYNGERVP